MTIFDVSDAKILYPCPILLLFLQINSYLAPVSCKNLLLSILQKVVFFFIVYVLYVAGMCQSKGNISLRRQHSNQWATCQNKRHVASWAKCAAPQVNFTFSLSAKQEWHNKQSESLLSPFAISFRFWSIWGGPTRSQFVEGSI